MDQQSVDGGTDAVPADLTGSLLADKYRVVRPLGRGSTGTVYLCWHAALEKHVALKVLHPELSTNPGIVTRFQREAQATARLDHAHSVRVTDFGHDEAGGFLYLAMEHVEGRDLGQVLTEDWPLSDQRVVSIMSQVLSALEAAHALGIVHRDLKPENILVRAAVNGTLDERPLDDVKVCDFGIAQLSPIRLAGPAGGQTARLHAVTAQGRVVGTPAYMSPEQARAEAQDARSDIYSAGIVLFQLLTRTTPFVAETPLSVAVMHCVTPPPPPSGYGAVNAGLEAVCLKALSKTREARFQSAREMQLALEAVVAKRTTRAPARRISAPPPAGRASRAGAVRSDTRTLSLAPAEVVVTRNPAKRQFPMLKGAAVALVVLAIIGLPSLLHRKPGSPSTRMAQPLAMGSQATLLPATSPSPRLNALALPYTAVNPPPPAAHGIAAPVAAAPRAHAVSPVALALAAPAKRSTHRAPVARAATMHETETKQAALEQSYASDAPALVVPGALDVPEPSRTAEPASEALVAPVLPAVVTSSNELPAPPEAPTAPVVPAVALRLAPPPTAAPTPTHRVDPGRASVSIGMPVTHHAAVSKASLRGALNQSALTRCYQDALRSGSAPDQPLTARLDLATGMGGHVVSASLDSSTLPSALRQCIEQVARAGRLREADTGEAQASVTLSFQPD
jgi:serine/threonine protein kinase